MNPAPLVSIVLVFHRENPFLRAALDSVAAQTWREWELVLVDNGCGLDAAALGPVGADARSRLLRLERNAGIPAGYNAGIAAARGEFIALMDYDDLMLPDRLEKQVAALRRDPALALVSGQCLRVDAQGRALGAEFALTDPRQAYRYSAYAAPFPTPACLGRRLLFEKFPYRAAFPYAADFDFLARAAEAGDIRALPELVLKYRWYGEQTTQSRAGSIEQSRAALRLMIARRRAGREEDLAGALRSVDDAIDASNACRRAGEQALREGFALLAAYHARRMLVLRKGPRTAWQSTSLAARAIARLGGPERRHAMRMYLTGPVRALGLTPTPLSRVSV